MIKIIPYQQDWPFQFRQIARELKETLGGVVMGIHHIGSTAIPGMAAKAIIDIQISVREFAPDITAILLRKGFKQFPFTDHRPSGATLSTTDLDKMFFVHTDPDLHVHVRQPGRFNHRYALLCRDFLRNNAAAALAYQAVKFELVKRFADDPQGYYDIKDPVFDVLMAGAELWAEKCGWYPSISDI